jgi:hypothetical protein
MRSKKVIKHLEKLLDHLRYYNIMAPFPVYDTEYVEDVDKAIKKMKEDKTKDYDSEGVVACRHCKSLHIVTDDIDNNICMRCGSVNELQEFSDIYKYNEFISNKNND